MLQYLLTIFCLQHYKPVLNKSTQYVAKHLHRTVVAPAFTRKPFFHLHLYLLWNVISKIPKWFQNEDLFSWKSQKTEIKSDIKSQQVCVKKKFFIIIVWILLHIYLSLTCNRTVHTVVHSISVNIVQESQGVFVHIHMWQSNPW